jgi:hypothetical protein
MLIATSVSGPALASGDDLGGFSLWNDWWRNLCDHQFHSREANCAVAQRVERSADVHRGPR